MRFSLTQSPVWPNYRQYYLLGGLALSLPVLEIGKPDPVEDEDRHAEDEEEGEGVSLLLDGTVAEKEL